MGKSRIKKIASVQNGYAFSSKLFNRTEGMPLIRIRDIFSIETDNLYLGEYKEDFVVNKGDILIGMDGDFKVSKWPGNKGLLNQLVCRIHFDSAYYEKEFLFICIQPYLNAIHSETSAVTVKHLSSRTINDIPLPLPPLPEQRAIVAKIEELFSDLDKGIADLKKAQGQLVIFRQAVLKKAFEGELTKEWREQQTNLQTAEELLEQIKEERQKHYEQQIEDWKQAVKAWEENGTEGKKPAKPKKLKEASLLNKVEENYLSDLPESWLKTNLESITLAITDGDHQAPPKSESGIPFITISNVKNNKIDFSNTYFVPETYYSSLIEYRKAKIGDVLYTVTGSFGIPVIVSFEEKFCFQRHIGLVRPLKLVSSNWLFWLLQTQLIYRQAVKKATGTAQKTVGLASLRSFCTSYCSKEEQHQIVREIESRLSVCDKVEESITESLEKAKALRQSILKKAFEGTLLSVEEIAACKAAPDYEPASILLEKIKAERKK